MWAMGGNTINLLLRRRLVRPRRQLWPQHGGGGLHAGARGPRSHPRLQRRPAPAHAKARGQPALLGRARSRVTFRAIQRVAPGAPGWAGGNAPGAHHRQGLQHQLPGGRPRRKPGILPAPGRRRLGDRRRAHLRHQAAQAQGRQEGAARPQRHRVVRAAAHGLLRQRPDHAAHAVQHAVLAPARHRERAGPAHPQRLLLRDPAAGARSGVPRREQRALRAGRRQLPVHQRPQVPPRPRPQARLQPLPLAVHPRHHAHPAPRRGAGSLSRRHLPARAGRHAVQCLPPALRGVGKAPRGRRGGARRDRQQPGLQEGRHAVEAAQAASPRHHRCRARDPQPQRAAVPAGHHRRPVRVRRPHQRAPGDRLQRRARAQPGPAQRPAHGLRGAAPGRRAAAPRGRQHHPPRPEPLRVQDPPPLPQGDLRHGAQGWRRGALLSGHRAGRQRPPQAPLVGCSSS